ncbi:hypothetical protein XA39_15725 [Acinetobacter tandoii]|uniref:hypothetical protein n=1 Tax=Acinetobacter tandoii TaxID=202954 RepID=UPI000C20636D|nr:hypothetical protein [Acinetobacter tandoii]PJG41863.1 hypothetical protein XA39_15725 [Acinetobacter tandoii]
MENKEKLSSLSTCPICHEKILDKIVALGEHYQVVHNRFPTEDEIHQFRKDTKNQNKYMKSSKLDLTSLDSIEKKIYHYCPVCDRSMGIHKNNPELDTWEKVLKDHFNRRHESLCREPTSTEIKKFAKGTKKSKKGSIRALQAGAFSPR